MLAVEAAGERANPAVLSRLLQWWFAFGWPAFGGLMVVVYLMVATPSWPRECL